MFKHILVPTDGSAESDRAIRGGMHLARDLGAKVTGLHVVPEFHIVTTDPEMLEDTPEEYALKAATRAKTFLQPVEEVAREFGVPCVTVHVMSDDVHDAIIQAASKYDCDLIAMAAHGRKGAGAVLPGSETQKVLVHSLIPVLVFR